MARQQVILHAVFKHGGVGPSLIEIGTDSVSTVTTNDHASHATLIQGLGHLSKVIFGMVEVRIDDDDLPDVLLAKFIDGSEKDEVLFATGGRGVGAMHVNDGSRSTGHHRH